MIYYETELYHHGIRGQKWGKKNGPPYPLGGRQYSVEEEKYFKKTRRKYSDINKKHYDTTISKGTELKTLSYDKNRTKNTDMFYAAYDKVDTHFYRSFFNRPITSLEGKTYKYSIGNTIKNDLKVASEDSSAKAFMNLFAKDRDFSNYVMDQSRMKSAFDEKRYYWKGYRESKEVLEKMRQPGYTPTNKDLKIVYRMFNYTIPFDGAGNKSKQADALNQRKKFFNELKKEGYGALLDTNDALYGGLHAHSPIIVFDSSQLTPSSIMQTKMSDKLVSDVIAAHSKMLQTMKLL